MSLVKCEECGAEVSTEAKACPACGAPPPKGTSTSTIVLGGILVLMVGSCIFRDGGEGGTAPTPPVVDEAKERNFRTVVAGARWIKSNMKNPKSFELVSAMMVDGGKTVCFQYRGTNSFNATVLNYRVITDTLNSGASKDWNAHCAGKTGEDFSYARHAI